MARYFFDFEDANGRSVDQVGSELAGIAAIRLEASESLAELAGDMLRHGLPQQFGYIVRDEAGIVVLEAHVSFTVKVVAPRRQR